MAKPYSYSNFLSMDAVRFFSHGLESFYGTDLYTGSTQSKLIHSRSGSEGKWYRKFKISDDLGFTLYYDLSFIQPEDKYNFGGIISFFDLKVLKDGCNDKSNRFLVKAIVKGVYPKLDTVELYGSLTYLNLLEPHCGPQLCNRAINGFSFKPDSCKKAYQNMALYYAHQFYNRYIDSIRSDFLSRYIAKCKYNARQTEQFAVQFQRSVYHYTLYYYDQLGNLIQTVPPSGVDLLSDEELEDVRAARINQSATPVYPNHALLTRYKYNTLNQLVWQSTPDAGESNFWYDRLGRLVTSQNSQQYSTTSSMPNKRYSYTLYDSLGRIKEVGELTNTTAMSNFLAYDYNGFVSWVGSGGRTQITRTYYDRVKYNEGRTGFMQQNLRSRVATITLQQAEDTAYDEAVHYNYDIHGNVKSMVRENKQLIDFAHHLKKLEYEYDLISGKVNKVVYQKNKVDQFIHEYNYDAENRIKKVNTSTDNVHFETDARYTYYKHGPLARTEIGRLYVQGVDYIYTLQGWLKGVNTTSLAVSRDPGNDGHTTGENSYVSRDEYGFSLRYFKGDYSPINLSMSTSNYFDISQTGTSFEAASPNLYNGNISNMVTGIRKLSEPTLGRAFKYDQLNRIKEALSFSSPNYSSNQWGASQASDSAWYESFSYDPNGNITHLKRKGNKNDHWLMDSLVYVYQNGTNKLTQVDDKVNSAYYSADIDDQQANNYTYDLIGNLTRDIAEKIDSIQWNVYGKITSITRTESGFEEDKKANLYFSYTPDGHRSTKGVSVYEKETEYTYYVRDAQGNVMAAYELNNTKKLDSSQLTIENINVALTGTSGVELFADFAIDVLEIHSVSGLPADYTNHVLSENKISEVLIAFDPVDYLVNVNTGLQNDVLGNYSVTTILQSLTDEQGFSTFYTNIMPGVCSTNGTLNPLINFLTANTFLSDWDAYNSAELIAMGNDYDSWLVTNYSTTSMPCVDLTGVQALVASQTVAIFVIYLEQATVYHSSITSVLSSISSADFIQQLGTIASLTSTVIQVQFTPTQIFTALREAGLATLWGYISDEMAGYQADILEHYQTNHTTDYVHQCIIVLPSFIDSYITQGVSSYLQLVKAFYSNKQYKALMAALTELYFTPTQTLELAEWHIYGSSRLGIYKADKGLALVEDETITEIEYQTHVKIRYNGKKQYELSNHLGNVLVTISDRRTAICNEEEETEGYNSVVLSATDYYAFGSPMPSRTYQNEADSGYRFGFNGKENDNEVKGDGNQQDYGMRIYDGRLGRFLSTDPLTKEYPTLTPYQFSSNTPISCIDIDGLEAMYYFTKEFEDNSGYNTSIKILTESGILPELSSKLKQANSGMDVYFVVSNFNHPNGYLGWTVMAKGDDPIQTWSQLDQLKQAGQAQLTTDQFNVVDKQTIDKGRGAIIIVLNKELVDAAANDPEKLKVLMETMVHEYECHAEDDKDGKDDNSTKSDHEKYYNQKCTGDYSPAYKDIKPSSTAGNYKNRIEKAYKSFTERIERIKTDKKPPVKNDCDK